MMTNAATKSSLVSAGPFVVLSDLQPSPFCLLLLFLLHLLLNLLFLLLCHASWALISSYSSSSAASSSSYMATYICG